MKTLKSWIEAHEPEDAMYFKNAALAQFREMEKPVKETGDWRLRRISRDKVQQAYWSADFLQRSFKNLHERIDIANALATKRKVPPYIDRGVAMYLENQVKIFAATLQRTEQELEESLKEKP